MTSPTKDGDDEHCSRGPPCATRIDRRTAASLLSRMIHWGVHVGVLQFGEGQFAAT
jgi:hypothetical protein